MMYKYNTNILKYIKYEKQPHIQRQLYITHIYIHIYLSLKDIYISQNYLNYLSHYTSLMLAHLIFKH